MKTTTIAIAVLIVLIGGYYLYQRGSSPAAPGASPWSTPTPPPAATTPPPATVQGETYQVVMDSSGFSPANLTIEVGDTVTFVNRDTRSRWPASGLHPTHLLCPGFDALEPLAKGKTYAFTFREAKECPMHDHLIPSIRGKITVTE